MEAYKGVRKHGPVLVHCALGMTRSATVAAVILIEENVCVGWEEAVDHIRSLRPEVTLSPDSAPLPAQE